MHLQQSLLFPCLVSFLIGFLSGNIDHAASYFHVVKDSLYRDTINKSVDCDCSCAASYSNATANPAVPASSSSSSTAFDSIVQTAYERALLVEPIPKIISRPATFNVSAWEHSGLTTKGGLKTSDRHTLGQIYRAAHSVFEWGLGESTYMANYVNVPRYAGIDSDPSWVAMAREKVSPRYRFYFADIGPTRAWGYPVDESLVKSVLHYQLAPLIVEPKPFDVYMVDGRYRLACALAAFLHASARGAPHHHTTVLIHDCKQPGGGPNHRNVYNQADTLLNLTMHSGSKLCVFQRFPQTTNEQIMELWQQYNAVIHR